MRRRTLATVGVFAGAFVAGFAVRTLYAWRDVVRSLDRQDVATTRAVLRENLKRELHARLDSL